MSEFSTIFLYLNRTLEMLNIASYFCGFGGPIFEKYSLARSHLRNVGLIFAGSVAQSLKNTRSRDRTCGMWGQSWKVGLGLGQLFGT
ncbi:hypothetical protein [Microcoleus sp. B9-D4]|uniref:hypothetical protein n=1 Tax=Microcoleus sp. B9-D4 TaxID=2818711 RepID=UPI002FD32D41